MDLLIVIVASVLLVLLAVLGESAVRIALGLIFALFFPGYTLLAALFPKKGDLDGIQRLALSFGLSIAVVPLIGLILNYTPWGIGLYSILISILLFIAIMAGIAWYRRRRLSLEQRFEVQFHPRLFWFSGFWRRQSLWNRVLAGLLVIAIVGVIGTLVYLVQTPKIGEKFTEFYVLGQEGKAEDYPREVALGEKAKVILVIVNREHETAEYLVEITVNAEKVEEIGPITLAHEEKWEREVSFAATKTGRNQRVEFVLYKSPSRIPLHRLHLWINVVKGK